MGFLRQALLLGSFVVVPAFGVVVDPADVPNVQGNGSLKFTETFGIHYPAGTLFSSGEIGAGAKLVSIQSMELTTPVTTALFDYDLTTEAVEDKSGIIAYVEKPGSYNIDNSKLCLEEASSCIAGREISFNNEKLALTLPAKFGQQDFKIKFSERGSSAEIQPNGQDVVLDVKLKSKSRMAKGGTAVAGGTVARITILPYCRMKQGNSVAHCMKSWGNSKILVNKPKNGVYSNEKYISFSVTRFERIIDADKFPAGIYEINYDVDFYVN